MYKLRSIFLLFVTIQSTQSFTLNTAENQSRPNARKGMSLAGATSNAVSSPIPLKVAVIGAGAAGLATARILKRNGIQPTILEKDGEHGGVWTYHPNSKNRPVYRGLRTNLPRELMAYREFPWGGDGKTVSFVTHGEVKDYLSRYAKAMEVDNLIQYRSKVTHLEIMAGHEENKNDQDFWPQIKLEWESDKNDDEKVECSEIFDAVCICNGHYAAPANPIVPGIETFEGKIYHSIEYDDPTIFADKTVLCVGGRASGADLAREISQHATKVYLSDTTCPDLTDREGKPLTEGNVLLVPRTTEVLPDSRISFGTTCIDTPKVDIIIFCSGYDYQFPFINERSNLDLSSVPGERRIKPLYSQLWHAKYPSLTFVGLQHSVVPFPFFELQAEAIVAQLLRKHGDSSSLPSTPSSRDLPSLEARMEDAERDAASGGPKEPGRTQDTHFLGGFQWDECLKYAKFAGVCDDTLKKFIMTNKSIYDHTGEERKASFPGGRDGYRYNSYVRDDENESFQVFSLHHLMEEEEKSGKPSESGAVC